MPRNPNTYLANLKMRDEIYTPITDEIVEILWSLHREYGTWGGVVEATGIRKRMLYRIRNREYLSVSMTVLDKILTNSHHRVRVEDLEWYTVDGMVENGHWADADELTRRIRRVEGRRRMRRLMAQREADAA